MNKLFNVEDIRLSPEMLARTTSAKIQKRRENFVKVPIQWLEKLEGCKSAHTIRTAIFLLHSHWRKFGKPFNLPNGMLEYDGISRQTKWRALADLHIGYTRSLPNYLRKNE